VGLNGTLFFVANDGVAGVELWKSDGTEAGTLLVKDIRPGPGSSLAPLPLGELNGTLFFPADDGITGMELWRSDGTEAGTQRVKDIQPGSGGSFSSSSQPSLTEVSGTLFFSAFESVGG
jgi:ELWxxDGT repeat protein